MEEVDTIIILTIKDLGCQVSDSVKSLADFDTAILVQAIVACLRRIDESKFGKMADSLPQNMSKRVAVSSKLANAIKGLGYKEELSYHQVLYPTVNDSRKMLNFLSSLLPRDEREAQDLGSGDYLTDVMGQTFARINRQTWTPYFLSVSPKTASFSTSKIVYPFSSPDLDPRLKGLEEQYFTDYLSYISQQIVANKRKLSSSILDHNSLLVAEATEREQALADDPLQSNESKRKKQEELKRQLAEAVKLSVGSFKVGDSKYGTYGARWARQTGEGVKVRRGFKASRFTHQVDFAKKDDSEPKETSSAETEEEQEARRQKEREELEDHLTKLVTESDKLTDEITASTTAIEELTTALEQEKAKTSQLEADYKVKKVMFDLLPEADKNIAELSKIAENSKIRLAQLETEWEKHRKPLEDQYKALLDQIENRKDEAKYKLEQIKEMRGQMKAMIEDGQRKEEKLVQLSEIYAQLPKDINRAMYTRRILEIVKNVKKQRIDINKILVDVRNLNKEINTISETRGRSFAIADELIFSDAKKTPTAKSAYRHLAAMNENFRKLGSNVEEEGSLKSGILDLEAKIEQIQQRTSSINMEHIIEDLKQIKKENEQLQKQLKKKPN